MKKPFYKFHRTGTMPNEMTQFTKATFVSVKASSVISQIVMERDLGDCTKTPFSHREFDSAIDSMCSRLERPFLLEIL